MSSPPRPIRAPDRIRDAQRSREAILAAAERCFAERGFEGASLNDIAAQAGLSRGTPSYFFGSKAQLYLEVIERTFAAREAATRQAFAPVMAWCEGGGGVQELPAALASAARDYMDFLARRPSFVKLILREELAGAGSLHRRRTRSTAMQDAFTQVRVAGAGRGVAEFEVPDAVLLFVALTFAPLSYADTLMRALGRDMRKPATRRDQVQFAVTQMMSLIAPGV